MKKAKHVAIILDGNGRWAQKRGLSRSMGHKAGFESLNKLAKHVLSTDIDVLSVFAFSTENFKRSDEEVNYLMDLFVSTFESNKKYYDKNNIKVVFSGREKPLEDRVLKVMREIEEKTNDNDGGIFNICLNYGGQAEIVDSCKKIVEKVLNNEITVDEINENLFRKNLYQNLPPIDYMIRTSGELRISNFLLFNLAYAEFYFTNTLFPDFNEAEFDKAMEEYYTRSRRFGGYDKKKN